MKQNETKKVPKKVPKKLLYTFVIINHNDKHNVTNYSQTIKKSETK
jgi:hypothetical protein